MRDGHLNRDDVSNERNHAIAPESDQVGLRLKGEKEYLEQILAHMAVPPLDRVYIRFFGSTIFDISPISLWIGRTEMFEAFDQVYMLFNFSYFNVMLSSRKGATGGKTLRLSLEWIDSAWKLQSFNICACILATTFAIPSITAKSEDVCHLVGQRT